MKIKVGLLDTNECTRKLAILQELDDGSYKAAPFMIMTRAFSNNQYISYGQPIKCKLQNVHYEEIELYTEAD